MPEEEYLLIQRICSRDEKALAILCERYINLLYKITYSYTKNEFLSEQIISEVIKEVWDHPERCSKGKYLFNSLMEICLRKIARKKKSIKLCNATVS